jgi:hypothetical protein
MEAVCSSETSVNFYRAEWCHNPKAVYCSHYHDILKSSVEKKTLDNSRYKINYWVFGLSPSSTILKTREQNVLVTGSVSVLK